ncbi:MAG: cysteine desulfurase [Hyphomicrobiales bacterium]|nr:cysteine desulfurase [Hyphomicrobiales bacterium]
MRIAETIYLDHQATTPIDSRVLAAMMPYFESSFGNPHSSDHTMGWSAARAIEAAAVDIAALITCDPDEIIFTSGATESNNLALFGLCRSPLAARRRRILIGSLDHKSTLSAARSLSRQGFTVESVGSDANGFVNLKELEEKIDNQVLVVSICGVNSEIGTIQNIPAISAVVKAYGALFHCDAAQAACATNMQSLTQDSDLISLSAHKMYGPKGIGALYVRRDLQESLEPIIYGGGQQNGLRSGTLPTPLCVGFGIAAKFLNTEGARSQREQVRTLRNLFISLLQELDLPVILNGPNGVDRHPGNANLRFEGLSGHDLLATLQPQIAASMGSACSSGIPEPSYVLRGIGLSDEQASSSVRFSIGKDTSEMDVREAAILIAGAVSRMTAREKL